MLGYRSEGRGTVTGPPTTVGAFKKPVRKPLRSNSFLSIKPRLAFLLILSLSKSEQTLGSLNMENRRSR